MDFRHPSFGPPNRAFSNYPMHSANFSSRSSFFERPLASRPRPFPVSHRPSSPSASSSSSSASIAPFTPTPSSSLPCIARFDGALTPPSNYLPPSPPPSSMIKQAPRLLTPLPPSADSIFRQLSHHVLQDRHTPHYGRHRLQLSHVSSSNFESFLTLHRDSPILKGVKLEYDSLSGRIIMYPPPAPYHDCTPVFLQSVLVGLRGTPFDTPARQRSLSVREIGFRSRDGSYMVPDAAVVYLPRGEEPRLWPTIVVEVANSQEYGDVLAKVKRWFVKSRGMVEVALVLNFTAKNPLLDPACFLEVWRCRAGDVGGDEMAVEWESETTSSDGGEAANDVDDKSLDDDEVLPRLDLFGVSGNGHSSGFVDEAIPQEQLVTVADPLNLDDTDSSLSTIDDIEEPDVLTVHATSATQPAPDSASSLRSLSDDDEDEISNVHSDHSDPNTSSSSSSSEASTSAYHLPHSHKHQLYLSDTRKTILPVATPEDPEMRYVALRYSDFFGSENVPEGRDGGEEVQLDLDELRMEIELLLKLTERVEESVKKHASAGSGGGGKRVRR